MVATTTNQLMTLKTKKFKTTLIKVSFKAKLTQETVTSRILLANVLRNSSKKFDSKKQLSIHLENLYGASLAISTKKQGSLHIISAYIQVVNEKFLKSAPPLFEEALNTLKELLINPLITEAGFDKSVVELESRLLKEEIEAIYDDKTTYALKKLVANMCEQENFGVSGDGDLADLATINEKTLVKTYESMLNDDEIDVVVLGDVDHEATVKTLNASFDFKAQPSKNLSPVDSEEKQIQQVTILEETQAVNQTKLNIGYRTGVRLTDADYFALLVMNGVFGAFAHSKLFVNVREKASLCYYCASQLDNFKGLMYVYSGLDVAQVERAIEIIDQQLTDICDGDISEKELLLAKKSIINAKRESLDSVNGVLADTEMTATLGITADEFIKKVEQVTIAEVSAVAKKIKKDTIFTLKPAKEAENNGN